MATNFLGSDNNITSTGGYFNGARNIVGNGNTLSAGGPGSNLNARPQRRRKRQHISAGATGGEPGNLNAGFNFFGGTNTVTAGPGPLALAGSIFKNGPPPVTQTGPGIAINNNRIGGAAATSGQSSTVRNTPASTSLLATGNNKFAPKTFATGSFNRAGSQLSGSLTKAGKQFSSSLNSLSKTVSDTVSRVTGALAGGAK